MSIHLTLNKGQNLFSSLYIGKLTFLVNIIHRCGKYNTSAFHTLWKCDPIVFDINESKFWPLRRKIWGLSSGTSAQFYPKTVLVSYISDMVRPCFFVPYSLNLDKEIFRSLPSQDMVVLFVSGEHCFYKFCDNLPSSFEVKVILRHRRRLWFKGARKHKKK